ncbi:hypothetical protein IIA95_02010 [Patescibacteria group bacterium]|nr:hypothetical protein [Patescibacteria group bacterium]
MLWWRKSKNFLRKDIEPDEIFLDSTNLPGFDRGIFEGRLEAPISRHSPYLIFALFVLGLLVFVFRLIDLQVVQGADFRRYADSNRLVRVRLPAERGLIYDRNGRELSWNEPNTRAYFSKSGLSHVLGYVSYPDEIPPDVSPQAKIGKDGIEKLYDELLRGQDGSRLIEEDVKGNVVSESTEFHPKHGEDVTLTIDGELQSKFFSIIERVVRERGFLAGSGVIVDPTTGEILAVTSDPEFSSQVLANNSPPEVLKSYFTDERKPFFFRALEGLYSPGSTFKPVIALAALSENIIDPVSEILSTGSIRIPNPYDPQNPTIFYDWKAHGFVNMWRALAVSSNVYFYTIGGGFEGQKGVGVYKIIEYAKKLGLGERVGLEFSEEKGLLPTPEWKEKNQPADPIWRVGDTYNLSIGQGMIQATPIQMARLVSTIATGGAMPRLHIVKDGSADHAVVEVGISKDAFRVVREGMRQAVQYGTATALSGLGVEVAGKTGTTEIGSGKEVNSWFIGFLPYENPRLAIAVVLERGSASNFIGAPFVAREIISWILANQREYIE